MDVDDLPEDLRKPSNAIPPRAAIPNSSPHPTKEQQPPQLDHNPPTHQPPILDSSPASWGEVPTTPPDVSQSVTHDLVSKLIEDDEGPAPQPPQPADPLCELTPTGSKSTEIPSVQQIQWYYLDPQGDEQGPFSSSDMMEWFEAGCYFPSDLMLRRAGIDRKYTPLNEMSRLYGRVPFTPGPAPGPIIDSSQPHCVARITPPPQVSYFLCKCRVTRDKSANWKFIRQTDELFAIRDPSGNTFQVALLIRL